MDVREVSFHIEFTGSFDELVKADKAVDQFKSNMQDLGKTADNASKDIGKAFDAVSKEGKKAGQSAAEVKKEVVSLKKDIANFVSDSKIGKLGKAIQNNLGTAFEKAAGKAKGALETFRTKAEGSLSNTISKSRLLTGALNDIKAAGTKAADAVKSKMDALGKTAVQTGEKIGQAFKKAGDAADKIGNTLTNTLTKPILGAATGAGFLGMQYEQSMAEVRAISGASIEDFGKLNAVARDVSANPLFSANEKASALKYMAMAGWDAQQSIAGLPSILNLATASGEDLGSVSDIVTDAMTAFQMAAEESDRFADVLAKASSVSNTNVALLGDTFKYVAPVAGALGYSVEDTATAVGLMANQGIKASQAGTALRAALAQLADPSEETVKAMEKLGIALVDDAGNMKPLSALMIDLRKGFANLSEAQKAQYASSIFGREAMSGMLAIINSSEADFNKVGSAIRNSGGAAQEMADIMGDTALGQIKELKNQLIELGLQFFDTFGKDLKNALDSGIKWLKEGMAAFSKLDSQTKRNIGKMIAFAAALGPVAKGLSAVFKVGSFLAPLFGKIAGAAGSGGLGGAAAALGIGLGPLIGILAGVAAAGYLLYKNWETVKAKGIELVERIKEKFSEFGPHIQNLFSNVQVILGAVLPVVEGFFGGILQMLGNLALNFTDVIGGAIQLLSGFTDFLVGVFSGDWEKAWEGVKNIFSGTWEMIAGIFKGSINFIIGGINAFLSGLNKIKLPDWIPGAGGKGINIPLIPTFAQGVTNFAGGAAIVGEEGPELVTLPRGANVFPNRDTEMLGSNLLSFEKMLLEKSRYSNEAMESSTINKNRRNIKFAPVVNIYGAGAGQEMAQMTKEELRKLWEEFIDDEDLAG